MKIYYCIGLIILTACKHSNNGKIDVGLAKDSIQKTEQSSDSLSILDTTIFLKNLLEGNAYHGPALTEVLAQKILFKHFENKGYYSDANLPDKLEEDDETIIVSYDTLQILNLNKNEFPDGIISYWLVPHGANGSGFKPHFAIISDIEEGYEISNEEFIPTGFFIDSIKNRSNQNILFGKDYCCTPPRDFIVKLR